MNVHAPISIEQQLKDAHKARQARFALAAANAGKKQVTLPAKPESRLRMVPAWRMATIQFDDHVNRWRVYKYSLAESPHVAMIRERCEYLKISIEVVMSHVRSAFVCGVRADLYRDLKTKFDPPPSLPRIGRMFKNRDHTTILAGIRKADKDDLLSEVPFHRDVERQRRAYLAWVKTHELQASADAVGISQRLMREYLTARGEISKDEDKRRVPSHVFDAIMEEYNSGVYIAEIAKTYHVSTHYITDMARVHGWNRRRPRSGQRKKRNG